MTFPYAAALFDMDGTLVDSTAVVEEMWLGFAHEHGLDGPALLAEIHGVPARATMERHLPVEADLEAALVRFEEAELARSGSSSEVPGAAQFLEALQRSGTPVAIVTSANRRLAEERLATVGIAVPDVLIAAGDVPRGKPAPDPYLAAAAALGVPIELCVVFEDAEAGIRSGLAAGATVIVVGGHESPTTAPLRRIADFLEPI